MWKKPALLASVGGLLMMVACKSGDPATSGCSGDMACANGAGTLQACFTADSSGACTSLYYKVGSMVFDCVSCDDQAYCANAAQVACGVPDASIPADANLPDGVSLAGDSGPSGEASASSDGAAPDAPADGHAEGSSEAGAETGTGGEAGPGDATVE